jgi:hypothetical protein
MRFIILLSSFVFPTLVMAATPKKLEYEVKPAAINVARLQAEINDLGGQIATLEGQIVEAKHRLALIPVPVRRTRIEDAVAMGANAEVISLEQDKASLMVQRQRREADLALRR